MHLMPSTTILSASLQYGVVSRSYSLTGKVLRGYLDASGNTNGLGIGNPNAEFSPHLTAVALTSDGGTAKVLWGFRNGDVAVTAASRAMDNTRPSLAKYTRCRADEAHEGMVTHVAWGAALDGPTGFATGCADGRVKVWNAKRVQCIWTSSPPNTIVPDACMKVAIDLSCGAAVGAFRSGTIVVWLGFSSAFASEDGESLSLTPREIRVPFPEDLVQPASLPEGTSDREIVELFAHSSTEGQLHIITAYKNSPHCHCAIVDIVSGTFRRVAFSDRANAPVRAIHPVFATNAGERSFVLTGDQLGWIDVYSLDIPTSDSRKALSACRRFEAHEDGAVTAISWNSVVLVSGSLRGTVKVWDSLTLAPVRTFPSASPRPAVGAEWDGVSQVLLEPDAVVVSVGKKVMAWKAGPVGNRDKASQMKKSRSSVSGNVAKWHRE